jgi:LAO/AO transport system kinase
LLCSALHGEGIDEVWLAIQEFRRAMQESGELDAKRKLQASDWMWTLLMDDLKEMFMRDRNVEALLGQVQDAVASGATTPSAAARRLLESFKRS